MLSPSVIGISYAWYLFGVLLEDETESTLFPALPGEYTVEVFFGNGCSLISSVAFVPDAVEEIPAASFALSPNPAKGHARLQVNNNLSGSCMILKDLTGRTVQTSQLSSKQTEIDCSQLRSGVYFIVLSREGIVEETMRLVVE